MFRMATCCLQANRGDQLSTNPSSTDTIHNAHTFKVQSSFKPRMRSCWVDVSRAGIMRFPTELGQRWVEHNRVSCFHKCNSWDPEEKGHEEEEGSKQEQKIGKGEERMAEEEVKGNAKGKENEKNVKMGRSTVQYQPVIQYYWLVTTTTWNFPFRSNEFSPLNKQLHLDDDLRGLVDAQARFLLVSAVCLIMKGGKKKHRRRNEDKFLTHWVMRISTHFRQ